MRKWIATFGGAGLIPFMPGTWGSLAAAGALWLIYAAIAPAGQPASQAAWTATLIGGTVLMSLLTVWLGGWAAEHFGKKDPGSFVLDEAAGICLTLIGQPAWAGWREGWAILAGFLAFRVFDIWKPPPVKRLERLPAGWGILTDDLMAAVYANLVCQVALRAAIGHGG